MADLSNDNLADMFHDNGIGYPPAPEDPGRRKSNSGGNTPVPVTPDKWKACPNIPRNRLPAVRMHAKNIKGNSGLFTFTIDLLWHAPSDWEGGGPMRSTSSVTCKNQEWTAEIFLRGDHDNVKRNFGLPVTGDRMPFGLYGAWLILVPVTTHQGSVLITPVPDDGEPYIGINYGGWG